MRKKVLIVDDSALMRRVFCDIIGADDRFEPADIAVNGVYALKLLSNNSYDLIVLDMLMPQMDGIAFLKEFQRLGYSGKIVVASTLAKDGSEITLEALSLGAADFIKKPDGLLGIKGDEFRNALTAVIDACLFSDGSPKTPQQRKAENTKNLELVAKNNQKLDTSVFSKAKKKVVAIASSTGGPKALQSVIPFIDANIDAPVLVVQHMPAGFTKTLAERLNQISPLNVVEAKDSMIVEKGTVYIAPGGIHMTVKTVGNVNRIALLDHPPREGVKPCANYMYESLIDSDYDMISCAVLTGMGADGTAGIKALKEGKSIYVVAQNQETCAVYGMPKCIVTAGLANEIVPLTKVADSINKNVGVKKDGC